MSFFKRVGYFLLDVLERVGIFLWGVLSKVFNKIYEFFLFVVGLDKEVDFFSNESRKFFLILSFAFLVFVVFFFLVLAISLTPASITVVPNVVNLDILDALSEVERAGLFVSVDYVISTNVPRGVVIRQIPSPGSKVREGKVIKLFVSVGSGEVILPDFSGKPADDVRAYLSSKGIRVSLEYVQSGNANEGTVIRTFPSSGTKVKPGDMVTVYVATGFSSMPMPNIIEMSWDQVLLIFASKGINVTINNVLTTDPDKDGKVVDQMPKEGDIVSSNVNVQAFVAVFGNEDVVKNTKFLLYSLDLRSLYNVEGVNYFIVKVVVSDSQGQRVITKEYQELTKLVLPLRIQGIGNVKVYINDTLVKESTL